MVEREQGRGRPEEETVVGGRRFPSDAVVTLGSDAGEDAKATRHAQFLAALDEVMEDHRNVLAALAK